jgi:hypothetical protein
LSRAGDLLPQVLRTDFVGVRQFVADARCEAVRVFEGQPRVQQAADQDAAQERDAGTFLLIDDDGFQRHAN